MYTVSKLSNGLYDVLENGKSIRQGGPGYTAEYAAKFAAIPALAASGAPAPQQQQTQAPQPPTPPAPPVAQPTTQQQPAGSRLMNFSAKINEAISLAKQHRTAYAGALIQPGQGTVAASDFSSVLSNLNRASDTFSQDLTKTALDETQAPKPEFRSVDGVGVVQISPDGGYSVVVPEEGGRKAPNTLGGGAPSDFKKEDKSQIEEALRSGQANGVKIGNPIGPDGYIDPSVYVSLMQYWISKGGTKESFFSNFNYKNYINPENSWVWDQIGVKNPNADDGPLF